MLYYGGVGGIIVLENGVQTILRRYSTNWNKTGFVGNKANWYVLGYFWVAFIHLWTTAKSTYPLALCNSAFSMKYPTD